MKKTLSTVILLVGLCGCAKEASFHREYRQRIANAVTLDERRRNELEYQLLCVAEKGSLAAHFSSQDGVSDFDAWMLAKVYASEEVGLCLDLGLPRKHEQRWEVATFVGYPSKEGPPVIIDAVSGRLTCEGHPTVERPQEYIAKYEAKFKKT